MTRCPVCQIETSFADLIVHLISCLSIPPGSRLLVGPVIVHVSATPSLAVLRLADGIELDQNRLRLRVLDRVHMLTPLETRLLAYLADNAEKLLSRAAILNSVWGMDVAATDREVDGYVYRLRRLLRRHPFGERMIVTVRGIGYRFEPPAAPPMEEYRRDVDMPSN